MDTARHGDGTGGARETPSSAAERLFAGPGEMRVLGRALDWSSTPLGPVGAWPVAVRAAVRLCLDSGIAMCVYAGPELVLVYNDDFTRALGAGKHPWALGRPAREVWPEIWGQIEPEFAQVMAGGPPIHHVDQRFVIERDGRTEDTVWTYAFSPVRDEDGAVVATHGVVMEATARARAEAALRESEARLERRVAERTAERDTLRRQLLDAEEGERRWLARELHDEAGQHLTALGLGLQALSDVAPPGSEIDRRAAQLRTLVAIMGRELHALAVRLRPKALDDFGLEAAVTAHAEEWSERSRIRLELHAVIDAERLPAAVEGAVYRIVQEALANVARHSGAAHASVVVERRDGQVVAVVADDGRGFEADALPWSHGASPGDLLAGGESGGLGLLGMRERAALLGGSVEVESDPERGTTVFVRIPIVPPGGTPAA